MIIGSRRKWFLIGIIMGLNPVTGLVFGIGLATEPSHRRDGIIIILWTIAWAAASYLLFRGLVTSGYLPRFQVIP